MVHDNLGKGRLRSVWTHRVDMPRVQGEGGKENPPDVHQSLPGDFAHPQLLHQLHHDSSQAYTQGPASRGGAASGVGAQPDSDTPKKAGPSLSFLQQQQQQLYSNRPRLFTRVDREILCNALACAGASMADPLMSMVDSYYAGKLGTTALAALGSNGALFSVLYFLCFTALAVLCTQAMASANSRGDREGCGRGFIQAVTASLIVSSVLVLVLLSMPETLLGLFQTDAEVLALAKTYCMIRALSLPAALCINVSQAAFRSMLDLTTPFCIVMAVNAANFLLNELLMVIFPYGMAGCGWASVVSQYMGALMFAAVIYHQRHKFGIPEALECAEDRLYEQQHLMHSPGAGSTGGSSTLVATKLNSNRSSKGASASAAAMGSNSKLSPQKRQPGRVKRHSRTSSADPSPRRGLSPRRSRESSGTLRIDVTAFEQQLAKDNGSRHGSNHDQAHGNVRSAMFPSSPSRRRSNRYSEGGTGAGAAGGVDQVEVLTSTASGNVHHRHGIQQQQWSTDPVSAFEQHAAAAAGGDDAQQQVAPSSQHFSRLSTAANSNGTGSSSHTLQQQQQQHGSSGGCYQLHRWDSAGSESKLPRYLIGGSTSALGQLLLLLRSLDWVAFVRKFAGMTTRGMLILSTYTTANVVTAKGGTAMMAAHQVVQQQQQLQMSFAWSFLHVGQSMTANLFHSNSAVSGPKAARRLSERIVRWAMMSCMLLACGTYMFRHTLPTIFTKDEEVQELVLKAALPAALMLGLGWNNAVEGCLLAADEQPYVVKMYPCAVAAALLQLARCYWEGSGLPGVWVALMTYYLVLLVGFAARYWVYRGKL